MTRRGHEHVHGQRAARGGTRSATALRLAVVGLVALVSAATSAPRYERNYPSWSLISDARRDVGCAVLEAFISKSGKTGVGLSVAVRGHRDAARAADDAASADSVPAVCRIELRMAQLVFAGASAVPLHKADIGAPVEVSGGRLAFLYIPLRFDNNRAWNEGRREGVFVVDLDVNGVSLRWQVDARHRLDGYYRERGNYHQSPVEELAR